MRGVLWMQKRTRHPLPSKTAPEPKKPPRPAAGDAVQLHKLKNLKQEPPELRRAGPAAAGGRAPPGSQPIAAFPRSLLLVLSRN